MNGILSRTKKTFHGMFFYKNHIITPYKLYKIYDVQYVNKLEIDRVLSKHVNLATLYTCIARVRTRFDFVHTLFT